MWKGSASSKVIAYIFHVITASSLISSNGYSDPSGPHLGSRILLCKTISNLLGLLLTWHSVLKKIHNCMEVVCKYGIFLHQSLVTISAQIWRTGMAPHCEINDKVNRNKSNTYVTIFVVG